MFKNMSVQSDKLCIRNKYVCNEEKFIMFILTEQCSEKNKQNIIRNTVCLQLLPRFMRWRTVLAQTICIDSKVKVQWGLPDISSRYFKLSLSGDVSNSQKSDHNCFRNILFYNYARLYNYFYITASNPSKLGRSWKVKTQLINETEPYHIVQKHCIS